MVWGTRYGRTERSINVRGRITAASLPSATDLRRRHAADTRDRCSIDATTFEVIDTIETLRANSTAAADGALWVIDTTFGVLQRFDID